MGGVGLFVLGIIIGIVIVGTGVLIATEIEKRWKWIPTLSGLVVALGIIGLTMFISRHNLKIQVEEFKTAKLVYEQALASDDLSGLERIEIVDKIVTENKWLAKTKYNVKQWYCWFLPDEIVDGLEEIEVSKGK